MTDYTDEDRALYDTLHHNHLPIGGQYATHVLAWPKEDQMEHALAIIENLKITHGESALAIYCLFKPHIDTILTEVFMHEILPPNDVSRVCRHFETFENDGIWFEEMQGIMTILIKEMPKNLPLDFMKRFIISINPGNFMDIIFPYGFHSDGVPEDIFLRNLGYDGRFVEWYGNFIRIQHGI